MAAVKRIIDFMKLRHMFAAISLVATLISLGSLAVQGLQFGLDFTGGTLVEVQFAQDQNLDKVRGQLEQAGLESAVVQSYGTLRDIVVRVASTEQAKVGDQVMAALQSDGADVTLKRTEFVGSQVGGELRDQGGLGMLLALAGVMLYVAARFQFKFSFAAVLSLVHDVIIVLGVFSLFQIEFDLTVLAAVLAVIGYSLNDSIVVADRIRENFRKMRKAVPVEVVNTAMTDTLGRTTITSLTTWLVVWALFLFGGDMIHGFALALLIGIGVGTYSSVYVCASLLIYLKVSREDLLPPAKEELVDDRP
ncbi:preprotein translocase subunit SecF [Pokkaliibacter plantistimulans]|uniref:Protein-export membrane protein SecF n=1 Tax=Pokkaliibacter plantistimulans TaxID=1635171 RepID=A0ABX5LSL2_9GAMM|nr:protein translocase subunit SecF [Pokkaliibacter plantistimulans]PXF29207.1 preprotein translocase subunit SecF [Pokkaliibacter plantistimulans]